MQKYRAKISGPLLDRIDLHVEAPALEIQSKRSRIQNQVNHPLLYEQELKSAALPNLTVLLLRILKLMHLCLIL